ncbi:HAD family hydrolase [Algoriphagus persicinus]|uniref:HAD family hydrolase n=1 Tax=Algoriphagus persicinus TaxID=3108754 RepID=UPI002B3EF8C8|nr:HAD family hydrolase [Algoriphagus sp. E1-3-M2]MEB2787210.1 HAD hydrolase-like protein [Algoriphagus sp. E1-3-M2]
MENSQTKVIFFNMGGVLLSNGWGHLSREKAAKEFNHSRDFSKEEFKNFMSAQSVELPDMLPWLKEWKKNCGVRVFSINNESRELNDYRIKKFSLHQCFDGFFSSCHLGMRKPDPGIFQLAMGIAQARPEECAYFDDRLMLAEAGEK